MMYMGKYDFAAEKNGSKLAAFKLWNLNFKAAPRAGVVSKDILSTAGISHVTCLCRALPTT
jgi:hypothetical protein